MERRAIFDAVVSQKWEKIIDELPPQYIADQFMGKATDKMQLEAKIEDKNPFSQKQVDAINKAIFENWDGEGEFNSGQLLEPT